ncbi:hypothetical protein [Pleurocapsa sp. PCC 7319]|uniref:hypothetical protein n=1 Tax=Pleurocapsa sp. PCC 7319 TaxID=118161 RepID=UPI00034BC3B8|nr:hypothetical protein [Pleurocapsa sp. PCC 7319]
MYLDRQGLLTSKVVVSIPINLNSRQEISSALTDKYGMDYLLMGRVFQATKTNQSCAIDLSNRPHVWEIGSSAQISPSLLEQINSHQRVIQLSSDDSGYNTCLKIAKFTQVFLDIGGIAATVESAGISHEKQKWLANYNSEDVFDIYSLFVALVEGDDNYHSCGMHNFGKADVAMDISEEIALAIYVMNVFNYYRLTESPILQDGHTFQPDIESPTYQIKWTEYDQYQADSLLYNPYGKWHLSRLRN